MNIREIYTTHQTPLSIQHHQLRVAAVGKLIAEAHGVSCNMDTVVQTGLLHDMGNIIKVTFDSFPDFWLPEGIPYWERVQRDYIEKYGKDEHSATIAIAEEIGVAPEVLACINMMSFTRMDELITSGTLEQKICTYADYRIGPFGVLSLTGRLDEAKKRYSTRTDRVFDVARHEKLVLLAQGIEQELFAGITISPADITDVRIDPIISELQGYTFP